MQIWKHINANCAGGTDRKANMQIWKHIYANCAGGTDRKAKILDVYILLYRRLKLIIFFVNAYAYSRTTIA